MTLPKLAASLIAATLVLGGIAAAIDRRAAEREAAAEAAYPPTGTLVEVDGLTVHAHVEGSGPDLVLIHGASGNTRDFTFSLVDRLKDDFRVIAFDRPGLGWSEDGGTTFVSPLAQADILRKAAARLGVQRPVVLGHSYGGAVAMAWALRDPQGTGAVVAVSAATMPWPGGLGPWYAISGSRIGGALVVPVISALAPMARADQAIAEIFAPAPVPPGYARHIGVGLTLRRDSLRTNARQVGSLKPYVMEMAALYPRLDLPVELVHGTADTIVPLSIHSAPLAQVLPDARLTIVDGAGHMPHHTHPETIVAAVESAARRASWRP